MPNSVLNTLFKDGLQKLITQINQRELGEFNEATAQHHLALAMHLSAQAQSIPIEMILEKRVRLENGVFPKRQKSNADIDLFVQYQTNKSRLAVELKLFKAENHREPNNRYDAFADIGNLEIYKSKGLCDLAYFVLITDHPHYFDQNFRPLSDATAGFNLRQGSRYEATTTLEYKTAKPYGPPITLMGDYSFQWQNAPNAWRVLALEV
jgi:hypothetical protein